MPLVKWCESPPQTKETHKAFENVILGEALPPERHRKNGKKWWVPKILQAGNRWIKQITLSIKRKDNSKGRVLDAEVRDKDSVARDKNSVARAKDPEGRASSHRL